MNTIIEVNNLSKKYRISHKKDGSHYFTFREDIIKNLKKPFDWITGSKEGKEDVWALKNVSFEVERGEILGIIGPNGAGKSTLLKILTRITPPSEGKAIIRGRVGSLLEVGIGFHPELTGRENIYLNGAILGMKKKEIDKKFNDIVDFAGIEKFLDTPVKRYSSGMYIRLAFSVAIHMELEILLVDEVLAVGDAEFQKKCLGKMDEITKKSGRTILFVSHNMAAVQSLCQRSILLRDGKIEKIGPTQEVVREYMKEIESSKQTEWKGDSGDNNVRISHTWVRTLDSGGRFHTASDIEVGIEINVVHPIRDLILGFWLYSEYGYELAYALYDDEENSPPPIIQPGRLVKKFIIPADTLARGIYSIKFDVGIHNTKRIIGSEGGLIFNLENISGRGTRFIIDKTKGYAAIFRPKWTVK